MIRAMAVLLFAVFLIVHNAAVATPCCSTCKSGLTHFWALDTPNNECAETCFDKNNRIQRAEWYVLTGGKGHIANTSHPCAAAGFHTFNRTDVIGNGPLKMTLDKYLPDHRTVDAAKDVAPDLDIILYGATGCVGHLAAHHLANQTGLKWAIADINATRLQVLAQALASAGGPSSKPEQMVFLLNGKDDVKKYVRRTKAVATAAGPFSIHGGEVLLSACAELGVHYTDTSDEFYWQRWMIDRHDSVARASGAKVVLTSGFCVLAGDLGSQLALAQLPETETSLEVGIDAWLETYNGGLSAGVINTGKALKNATYPKAWDSDPYVLAPNISSDLRVDTKVTGMKYPAYIKGEGAIVGNIFGPYDARLIRRTFAERNQRVALRVGALASLYPRWTAFLASHPKSWSSLTKCPSADLLAAGSWKYRFTASRGQNTTSVLLSGQGDPGYHFTAVGLAEAGLCLAGQTSGCLAPGDGGVFTSMSALDSGVLKNRLEAIGLVRFS